MLAAGHATAQQPQPPSVTVDATAVGAPLPAVAAAWDEFQRSIGGPWLVRWNAATGTPRAIFGHGYELAGWRGADLPEARLHAEQELRRWSSLLGAGTSEFREVIGARMGRTWTFTFEQWFRGLPVLGGRADVRIHMAGRLCHLGSTAWPIPADFDIAPRIGDDVAIARAWLGIGREPNTVPQPGAVRATRLVIWGDADAAAQAPFALAWEVPIRAVAADGSGPIGRAYVDAKTGAFLHWSNDKHECGRPGCSAPTRHAPPVPTTITVMGWTHTGYSPVSIPTNVPLAGIKLNIPGIGLQTADQNGQITVDLSAPVTVTAQLEGAHTNRVFGPNALTATTTLQPGLAATLQFGTAASTEQELAHTTTYYWVDRINVWARSILGNSPQLAVADNVLPAVNITSTCNAYYTGNTINFYASGGGCNNTAAASVVAHEWGHGLDDRYGGISQTNGLSEGWGDICSMYLLDDPVIGVDFFSGGGSIRNGNNGQQYPNGSGPHAQGESWMGFAWQFRQILRTAQGTPAAIALSNSIVLESIAANASNQPDAVIAAFQADDNDGLLANGTPHYAELVAACNTHSLPYPPVVPGYVQNPTVLGTTYQQGLPRRVEIDAIPLTGNFTQVRVHWNAGNAQQRTMILTGTQDRFQALLPGQLGPTVLQYHFEAQHSSGAVYRMPTSGEYGYVTLGERQLWFENFDNGAAGWTHGATVGTDDWQITSPVGGGGSGWSDPGQAFSGPNCAGTNLTNGGAYSASSDSWLRSPPIDCSGVPSVRIRFKRWISCAGPSDRLEMKVGGILNWATSFAPTNDAGWVTFDTLAPLAANNPAAVIEFRLVSDANVHYGGWQIDDLEVYTTSFPAPPRALLTMLPEQAAQGTTMTLQVTTPAAAPFLLLLGDTPGPTTIPFPGLPPLLAGGQLASLFGATAANGQFTASFTAPPVPATGMFFYSQLLTIDGTDIIASNPFLNLFTQ